MKKQELHYLESVYGCPVHWNGWSEKKRRCSCHPYWATMEECSQKAWYEDHSVEICKRMGGACNAAK